MPVRNPYLCPLHENTGAKSQETQAKGAIKFKVIQIVDGEEAIHDRRHGVQKSLLRYPSFFLGGVLDERTER